MIEYSDVKGLIPYESYKGRVGLVRNGIPSFIFINLKKNDEELYCCQVNFIKIETNNGDSKMKCTQLKILGKALKYFFFLNPLLTNFYLVDFE